ncbi:hypothetical protein SAMN05443637_109113 [Pseudonocardia thermophila]|uniref:DUF2993 domain-containing protein n=1 Tax=Pseudonocardia thermophila TaxID=1848 RepID=A0A1M6U3T0_PSETH|nr:hypothetical protein [Pseudonocardia thermophila]SHK63804.1 hypothetical protein SAMN05443637_109113 [Pseudonocardia thermophila]
MSGRWLPGWPEEFSGRLPIASDVSAALGIDPLAVLLRSTAAMALTTLRGRESTVTAGSLRVRGVLEELTVGPDRRGELGRLGEVRLAARDVTSPGVPRLRRVVLSARDARLRPALPVVELVATPVLVEVEIDPADLPMRRRMRLAVDPAGIATLHLGRIDRVRLEVVLRRTARTVTVGARALRVFALRIPLPGRVMRRRIAIDRLPQGVRLTGVRTGVGVVRVSAVLDRWSTPITASALGDVAAALAAGATELVLPCGRASER